MPVTDDAANLDVRTDFDLDVDLAARSPVNVMVTARDGAARAAWARTIHDRSARRDRPFIAVAGRVSSAADRALRDKDVDDWFVLAAGGTLFIDEIGELSPCAQARLSSLLTLQTRHASGSATSQADDAVRIISGSIRSLRADLEAGAFSDALFYRLNVIHLDQMDQEGTGVAD